MTPANLRVLVLAALTLGLGSAVAGCSDVDCSEIQRYDDSKLDKKLEAPAGLEAPKSRDSHVIPGGAPPAGPTGGGCLVRPPLVIGPPPGAPQQPAPTPTTKP